MGSTSQHTPRGDYAGPRPHACLPPPCRDGSLLLAGLGSVLLGEDVDGSGNSPLLKKSFSAQRSPGWVPRFHLHAHLLHPVPPLSICTHLLLSQRAKLLPTPTHMARPVHPWQGLGKVSIRSKKNSGSHQHKQSSSKDAHHPGACGSSLNSSCDLWGAAWAPTPSPPPPQTHAEPTVQALPGTAPSNCIDHALLGLLGCCRKSNIYEFEKKKKKEVLALSLEFQSL